MSNTNSNAAMLMGSTSRSGGLRATEVINLCPAGGSDPSVLTVAGAPHILLPGEEEYTPLVADGDTLFLHRGAELWLLRTADANAHPMKMCALPSAPRCAVISEDMLTVMTDAGPWQLQRHAEAAGGWLVLGGAPTFPPIVISAKEAGTYTAYVEPCTESALPAECVRSYEALLDEVSSAGALLQPVVARCRLFDTSGRLLHVTAPVVVMSDKGAQLTGPWILPSTTDDKGNATTSGGVFTAHAYTLHVDIADTLPAPWNTMVARMEVQITPQFHPVKSSGRTTIQHLRGDASTREIAVTLSGITGALSPTRPQAAARNMRRTAAHIDILASTIAVVHRPFEAPLSLDIKVATTGGAVDTSDTLQKVLAKAAPPTPPLLQARTTTPASFTAQHCAISGTRMAWGNITALRAEAPSPAQFAIAAGNRRWSGATRIRYANGDCTVTRFSGEANPLTLSPLIAIPSPEATEITFTVDTDGEGTTSLTLPLTANDTGLFSIYTSPTPLPMAIDGAAIEIDNGDTQLSALTYDGVVAIADAADPLRIAGTAACPATVTAITAARTSGGAWNFGRARFLTFSHAGIAMACASSAGTLSLTHLSAERVISPMHVAPAADCAYALTDTGRLLAIAGTTLSTIDTALTANRLGWSASANEVIAADTTDNIARHYCMSLKGMRYDTSLVARGPWAGDSGAVFCVTERGLCDLSRRDAEAATTVVWRGELASADGSRRTPGSLRWNIKGAAVTALLDVERAWLSHAATPAPAVMGRLRVSGAVRSPITCPISRCHAATDLRFSLSATVSPDFTLTTPALSWK